MPFDEFPASKEDKLPPPSKCGICVDAQRNGEGESFCLPLALTLTLTLPPANQSAQKRSAFMLWTPIASRLLPGRE
jgi:hypothetical protein